MAGLPVELTDCSNPPEGFDALCDAYRLLEDHYVDPLDDAALAAGAARGMEEFESETPGTAVTAMGCPVRSRPPPLRTPARVYAEVQAETPAPPVDLVEAAVRGMIQYGLEDPHTVYLSPEALVNVTADMSGEVSGIGALVRGEDQTTEDAENCSVLSDTCILTIVDTLADSPAKAAGVQAGDGIVTVDGQDVDGLTVDEVVAIVRGPEGTDVALGLLRDGQVIAVVITRAAVVVPVVASEMIEPGIGYVALSQFTNNSAEQVHEALVTLIADGADRLIFDLRNDPGGSLTASVRIASEFLADGMVLRTQSPVRHPRVFGRAGRGCHRSEPRDRGAGQPGQRLGVRTGFGGAAGAGPGHHYRRTDLRQEHRAAAVRDVQRRSPQRLDRPVGHSGRPRLGDVRSPTGHRTRNPRRRNHRRGPRVRG